MTIILIIIFVASLAMGMLFLFGAKRQAIKPGEEKATRYKPPPPAFISGLISLYKWAFNYSVRPQAPDSVTAISVEPQTRVIIPPVPDSTTAVSVEPQTRIITPPAPALTGIASGIVFISEGAVKFFKWIFRIDR